MELMDMAIILFVSAIVVGVVQAIKAAGLPHQWAGLVSIAVGIVVMLSTGVAGLVDTDNTFLLALMGVISGLAAAGLWSAPKAAITGD
jgi:hypothetical protein